MDPRYLGLTLSLLFDPISIWRQCMIHRQVEKHHTWIPLEVFETYFFSNKMVAILVELPLLFVN